MRYLPVAALAFAALAFAGPVSAAPAIPMPGAGQDVGSSDGALVQKAHSARWYRMYRMYGPPVGWARGPGYGRPAYGYGPRPGYGYGRPYGEGPRPHWGGPGYGGW